MLTINHARRQLVPAAGMAVAALLAACQATPPPEQMARTSTATAPADLQLLCANALALQSGADSTQILPVSSGQLNANDYEVTLQLGALKHRCIVNADGIVQSVSPA